MIRMHIFVDDIGNEKLNFDFKKFNCVQVPVRVRERDWISRARRAVQKPVFQLDLQQPTPCPSSGLRSSSSPGWDVQLSLVQEASQETRNSPVVLMKTALELYSSPVKHTGFRRCRRKLKILM